MEDCDIGRAAPAPEAQDDAELVRRVAESRDREAFAALFARYAGKLQSALMRAGAAPDEAEEAAQEAMLSVWRRAESYDPSRAAVSSWIYAIARNRRIDLLRRARRPELDPLDPLFRPEPAQPQESVVAAADRDARLRDAVAGLSEEQREAVALAFFSGLTHAEIAVRTGAPLGTVKSRLRLAARRLREALGPDFDEELFDG